MAEDPIYQALEVLRRGGVILYPTDTVWGIGCDATNEQAVARIYDLKQSVNKKSMLVLLDQIDKVSLYIQKVPIFRANRPQCRSAKSQRRSSTASIW